MSQPPSPQMPDARDFSEKDYYCAHCIVRPDALRFVNKFNCKQHVAVEHDVLYNESEEGVDFYSGWQARTIYARRLAEADELGKRVAAYFTQEDYTVEDFLTDAGAA